MADHTNIGWADATWSVLAGCRRVSPGCVNCYAQRTVHRLGTNPKTPQYQGITVMRESKTVWTGEVRTRPEELERPLKWKKPRWIFPCSQSDLFHEDVPFEFTAAIFGVMQAASWHTFLALTKRPQQAVKFHEWLLDHPGPAEHVCRNYARQVLRDKMPPSDGSERFPASNVYMGVSVESPKYLERITTLGLFPAAMYWASLEPLLEAVDISSVVDSLGWIVVGGESGPGFRSCDPSWIVDIGTKCRVAGVPVHIKQDSGSQPEQQGRIPDLWWAAKDMPPWPVASQGALF